MKTRVGPGWDEYLAAELEEPYMRELREWLDQHRPYYPPEELVFNAFKQTPWDAVRVVIIGQDPYHGPGQAMGLSFSVPEGTALPPSLRNIFKEIRADLGAGDPPSGDLTAWARQGVLLLNSVLTVVPGEPGSHAGRGWERFTDKVVETLATEKEYLVFMLWGAYAQRKAEVVDPRGHLLLSSPHPSPLSASRGFFEQHHFSRCNAFLAANGLEPVHWDYWE